jgi:hypothetical protein
MCVYIYIYTFIVLNWQGFLQGEKDALELEK